jgi:hypothetical protein
MTQLKPHTPIRTGLALTKHVEEILRKNYPQGDNVTVWVCRTPRGVDGIILEGRITNDHPLQHGDGVSFKYNIFADKIVFPVKDVSKSILQGIAADIQAYFKKYPVI